MMFETMFETTVQAALWFSAIGAGLMAGVYFAFSTFIMGALAAAPSGVGPEAMRSINRVILRSAFMPLFFGTTLAALALAILGALRWSAPEGPAMLAGGLFYVVGMFVLTAARNVPLNERLDAAEPDQTDSVWTLYLRRWTFWNHLRTIASAAASAAFVYALAAS